MPKNQGLPVEISWPDEPLWPQAGYGNAFLVNHTPWDFTLRVGQIVFPPVDEETLKSGKLIQVSAIPVAEITIPPQAMRQLADALRDQVEKYERTYPPKTPADEQAEVEK